MRGRVLGSFFLKPPERSLLCILVLAVFFLIGAMAGFRLSWACGVDSQSVLSEYLKDFCAVMRSGALESSLWHAAGQFFLYPIVAFLVGMSPLGVVLIPLLSGAFGFEAMFTVMCFVRTYARDGIVPALALLAIRFAFEFGGFLLIAVEALPQAVRIAQVTIKHSNSCEPIFHGNRNCILLLFCIALLFFGACCERILTPTLFRLAMERIP